MGTFSCLRRPVSRPRRTSFRPHVQALEGRLLLATFTVTTTDDNGNNASPTPGSLRFAINRVNADTNATPANPDTIAFAIPQQGPGSGGYDPQTMTWVIRPQSQLPGIMHAATIDGYTQPGAIRNTMTDGDNAVL